MTLDNQDVEDSNFGSLESIEKELKSIKSLVGILMALVIMYWAEDMSDQADVFWLESFYQGLIATLFGLVTVNASEFFHNSRNQRPRTRKLLRYSGIGIFYVGFAILIVAGVVGIIGMFF